MCKQSVATTTTGTPVQKAARALLVDRGIAIKLSATTSTLPPFGKCVFGLQLVSNCVGSYLDRLQCTVGDLQPRQFWVRAGIIGSPVRFQLKLLHGRVG